MKNNALCLFLVFSSQAIFSDSFTYNSFNNHGVIGLINMPSARFYNESSYGFTLYSGEPDQKIIMTSNPFNWLEASFFYTNIKDKPYCNVDYDAVCNQDYKDKGFNFKLQLKEEGVLPALAIGINDIAGTGLFFPPCEHRQRRIDCADSPDWPRRRLLTDFTTP